MNQEVKTFENEGYLVEATEEAGCRLSVKINVKSGPTHKTYKQAVKKVNKQISIPGFRKGKAPDRTVISRYGSYVDQEWKEFLVNDAYRAALELSDIYPMNKESIQKPKIESCSLEEGAVVLLSYEHYPNVPTIDFASISIPTIEVESISEEKVEEIIEEVKRSNADWETIEDRPIQEGDFADISIDAIDEEPPKSIVKDRRFEVTDKRLASWLKKLLVGLETGQSAETVSEVDEQADENVKKNFKPTKVRVDVHTIYKIILPELNDELAKKVGADSTTDLMDKVRKNLEKENEDSAQQKRIEALENALLDTYNFDLPASIVESERINMLEERIQSLKDANLSDEEIKSQEAKIEQEVNTEIDRSFRIYFLNKQIAKQGDISLSNQELNDELVKQISQNPYMYGKESDQAQTREMVSRMATTLMQRKAKEYALSQVQTIPA